MNTSPSIPPSTARERADLFCGAVDEVIHREAGFRLGAAEQVAHVVADPGDSEQAGLACRGSSRLPWRRAASSLNRCRTTPGSSAPGRVPMQSPSSAVKPRVLSTLLPSRMAQRLAPLPRCATMTRPCAISGATWGNAPAMYSYERP